MPNENVDITADAEDDREQDVVSDTDADTRDVEDTQRDDFTALSERMTRIEDMLQRLEGGITAIRDAQGVMVNYGATIREDNPIDNAGKDNFVPLDKLDFNI